MSDKLLETKSNILLVGNLSDFSTDVQSLLQTYPLEYQSQVTSKSYNNHYAAVVIAPNFEGERFKKENKSYFVLSFSKNFEGDIQINSPFTVRQFENALDASIEFHLAKTNLRNVEKQHLIVSRERENLSAIGIALSAEKNLDRLLTMVLKEGRRLGRCEGASLYLVEKNEQDQLELVFKLTQNSKIKFDFQESRFSLTNRSLAGYVALTGNILNIRDVYLLNDEHPFSFDKSFDEKLGYRSKELLVLPMKNHKGKVIGVLQFVNNFGDAPQVHEESEKIGFSVLKQGLLEGLASQAAVAIDNTHLIENIQNLFEGFVSASVNAIESRDPVTSGHSFRVAELTTGLAEMLNKETSGVHKNLTFNSEQIREIRYASLLHDFGKVGVKENVLLKANKLHASRFQYLELKIEWQKQILEKKFYQQLLSQESTKVLTELSGKSIENLGLINHTGYRALLSELDKLEQYRQMLFHANQPSLMKENVAEELVHMADYPMHQEFPFSNKLLNDADFLSLSISKGSLTDRERLEIQTHVIHTQTFLERIPWTDELANIPKIAGSHHEKLDGTGYPRGLHVDEIPMPGKIMAIADIFDALTAQDRPYKKAVQLEHALDILVDEAKGNKIDSDILSTFIDSKVYQRVLFSNPLV